MEDISISTIISIVIFVFFAFKFFAACFRCYCPVKQGYAHIIERWGRYDRTLTGGLNFLMPISDQNAFIVDLREQTINVPPQECFTADNVKVLVDGVMYLKVISAKDACYGVTNYKEAAIQLAQTTTRSVIGTIELDRTFEERDLISSRVVRDVNEAGQNWGITVQRYEIRSISTPTSVRSAMEKQVTAEREGRALVAKADGDKQSRINKSEGKKVELINKSEGEMLAMINAAEAQAQEILSIADATAQSIEKLADAITSPGGEESQRMQLLERYFKSLASVARPETQVVLPASLTDFNALTSQLGISQGLVTEDERIEAQKLRHEKMETERLELEKQQQALVAEASVHPEPQSRSVTASETNNEEPLPVESVLHEADLPERTEPQATASRSVPPPPARRRPPPPMVS